MVKLLAQFTFLFLLAAFFSSINTAVAAPPTDFQTNQIIGSGITEPTGFDIAPDGRIFILERLGNVRLWVNNQLLIDKWIDQGTKEWTGTINLTAGQKYDIKMEYYENGGGAVAQLRWSSPSRSKQIIPQANLLTAP